MKTRREVLEANGYECICGYVVCDEKHPDSNNVIVSKEDLLKLLETEPQNYYWYWSNSHYDEVMTDEDSTWESFYDDWCDKHLTDNQDISFEDWEKKMLGD